MAPDPLKDELDRAIAMYQDFAAMHGGSIPDDATLIQTWNTSSARMRSALVAKLNSAGFAPDERSAAQLTLSRKVNSAPLQGFLARVEEVLRLTESFAPRYSGTGIISAQPATHRRPTDEATD